MTNRRQQPDRRKEDLGPPPGWSERRRRVERRLPEVEELEISQAEFFRLLLSNNRSLADAKS